MSDEKEKIVVEQNPFIWNELVTYDQKSSGAFFSQLFGWSCKLRKRTLQMTYIQDPDRLADLYGLRYAPPILRKLLSYAKNRIKSNDLPGEN